MTTKMLTKDESRKWSERLVGNVGARPLKFARAGDDGRSPYMIEVTNGQWEADPTKKTLVIHVIKRADINPDRALEVVRSALVDVFGPHVGRTAECDYRNVGELRKRLGTGNMINESHDSMTIIFPPGPITYTQPPESVRARLAHALRVWHERSLSW